MRMKTLNFKYYYKAVVPKKKAFTEGTKAFFMWFKSTSCISMPYTPGVKAG